MKVILTQQITDLLVELQRQFPEGTTMTHIVAIREYHKQLSSKNKDINDKRNQSN